MDIFQEQMNYLKRKEKKLKSRPAHTRARPTQTRARPSVRRAGPRDCARPCCPGEIRPGLSGSEASWIIGHYDSDLTHEDLS